MYAETICEIGVIASGLTAATISGGMMFVCTMPGRTELIAMFSFCA
jgi:hypothetical protein